MVVLAPIVFLALLFISAPYGRHGRRGWGPVLSAKAGWVLMEAPASLLMLAIFILVPANLMVYLFLVIWQVHYFHRAFVYPFTLRPSRTMPVAVVLMAVGFNVANVFLNGYHFVLHEDWYRLEWLSRPSFIAGALLFTAGFVIAKRSDAILGDLRKTTSEGYGIPQGFLYRWISCPNYLGESIQWLGWAVMTQAPAAWAFLLWTLANLAPRAMSHHRWYQATFSDYPRDRKAFLPFVF